MPAILGISAYYHDSAACLVVDGEIVAAAQEERFTRRKHDPGFPRASVEYCLREANLHADQIDFVGFYDKPLLKFDRLLKTYLSAAPRGFGTFNRAMQIWIGGKLWLRRTIRKQLAALDRGARFTAPILFADHHESHAASAFYPSPYEEAAILTIDGVGEWATASVGIGRGHDLTLLEQLRFPHSLGLLYSAITEFLGFKVNSGEYKVMGLAPYGRPVYVETIDKHLLELKDDGSFRVRQDWFTYTTDRTMTNGRMASLFDGPKRQPEAPLTQRDMDLARSIQDVTENILLRMARHAHALTGQRRLVLAGGVALNCVANGRLLREGPFDDLWVQPAAGDSGAALGVSLGVWHRYLKMPRRAAEGGNAWTPPSAAAPAGRYADRMKGSFLGPCFAGDEVARWLDQRQLPYRRVAADAIALAVANLLASQRVVGLFQGRMEFGPRALGGRSILADARSPAMQSRVNLKIKFREGFRPFAPSVLAEHAADWFELDRDSPYMVLVATVKPSRRIPVPAGADKLWAIEKLAVSRSQIPAVTHVDYSARVQTVRRDAAPRYYDIISAFFEATGCPVVLNTSFNVRGEPIVCTPEDAYRCFMKTGLDALVLEDCVLLKEDQPPLAGAGDGAQTFPLD